MRPKYFVTKGRRMFAGDHKRVFVPRCIVPSQGQGSALVWMNMISGGPGLIVETCRNCGNSNISNTYTYCTVHCVVSSLVLWEHGMGCSLCFGSFEAFRICCMVDFGRELVGSLHHTDWHWHGCPHRTSSKMSRKKHRAILWKIINQ